MASALIGHRKHYLCEEDIRVFKGVSIYVAIKASVDIV